MSVKANTKKRKITGMSSQVRDKLHTKIRGRYKSADKSIEFDVYETDDIGECYRVVYDIDTRAVIAFFNSTGITSSIHHIETGTHQECLDIIAGLKD